MKKLFAILLTVALIVSAVFVLASCKEKSDVELAIEAAEKMTLQELEAASKKEFEDNPDAVFNADSLTSGVKKGIAAFIEKYDWLNENNAKYNSKKGSEYQPVLNGAAETDGYVADFVMIQDASFVYSLVNAGFLLSYVPSGDGFTIAKEDQDPLVGVTFNKIWYYNGVNGDDYLKNVWQLTGKDGASLKKIDTVSYQSPLGEDINMSFLIMLTSPEYESQLKSSYKSYFGTDYTKTDDCKSIGYHYVEQFIKAVSTWHDSDTSEVKNMNNDAHKTGVYFAGLAKVKDYEGYKLPDDDPANWKKVLKGSGFNYQVEGFNGFVYNMWTLIPKTARCPYTACLFIRYLLSEEGFVKSFENVPGYYCSNTKCVPTDGTTLAGWKSSCLSEDPDYLAKNYDSVTAFIKQQLTAVGQSK